MQKINSETDLRAAILLLENKQKEEGKVMREQFHIAYDSIRPINLIKSTFREAAASQEIKDNILTVSVGLTAGYLSKALFVNVSNSPFRRLLGTVLQLSITNIVVKNPEVVQSLGRGILRIIKHRQSNNINEAQDHQTK
ncbi:MAG: hypothetical protein IPJ74_12835 [Saprospiraceae bacterium]|nr:hypothetical protein [Saprospiraceae bacterium]